jgi:aspartate/methionine/tyrosine aminotransferase
MNAGDEVLYPTPGFPIYESLIRFYGGRAVPYGFREGEKNFEIRVDQMADSITPRTKLLILNDLHNPTGAEAGEEEFSEIARLVLENDLHVLCDEAYFDLRYSGRSKSFAAWPGMSERCLILYTFSKKYAMTGWRIGAAIGPQRLVDAISQFNVNDESCTSHFIQYAAVEALRGPQDECSRMLARLKERRDRAVDILNSTSGIRCYSPNATFYLYPNITEAVQAKNLEDYEEFRRTVLERTGVSFCTRRHFGSPLDGETDWYMRLAYSGIDVQRIVEGLGRFKTFMES